MTPRLYAVALALAGLHLPHAAADTLTVCEDGCDYTTIHSAVTAAAHGDTISIGPGVYREHNINPSGKTLVFQGATDEQGDLLTTIDAQGNNRHFKVDDEETITINQLILISGSAPTNTNSSKTGGGAIYCGVNTTVTINGCQITGCKSVCDDSDPTCGDTMGGGALSIGGAVRTFEATSVTIQNSSFTLNAAQYGGAIYAQAHEFKITNCELTYNASEWGGAALIEWDTTIKNSTISNNTALAGGGIYVNGGGVTVTNCTLENNTAPFVDCCWGDWCPPPLGGGAISKNPYTLGSSGSGIEVSGSTVKANSDPQIYYPDPLNDCNRAGGTGDCLSEAGAECVADAVENYLDGVVSTLDPEAELAEPEPILVFNTTICGGGTPTAGRVHVSGSSTHYNSVDCGSTCPADLNGDTVVDGADLAIVLGAWGLPCDG